MGYLHNGVKTGGLPIDFVKRFVDEYGIMHFVETGTAGGDSVRSSASVFVYCQSIEVVLDRPEGEFPDNVKLHFGDSAKLLKEIAKELRGDRVVFWLDAHWSEPYEAPKEVAECPLLEEIAAIKGQDALVLIDDARLFFGAHPHPGDPRKWPKFQQVFVALRDSFPRHEITIVDDYIIAIPDYMADTFHVEWRERFRERYPEEIDRVKMEFKNTIDYLKKFIG